MEDIIDVLDFDEDGDATRYLAEERDRFQIDDDAKAAWAMRKLLSLRSKMAENEAIADAERTRIDAWLHHANAKLEPDVAYFESLLTMYARQQRETEGRKTVDTPYGVVKSRATQDKFKVVNDTDFIAWASANLPEAVIVKATPSLSALKQAVTVESTDTLGLVAMTKDGEIVPGVEVEAGGVNYTVEVTK